MKAALKAKFIVAAKTIYDYIEQFSTIAIFRHLVPDPDALGSQFGLYYFLKDRFPNKKIYVLGENNNLNKKVFPIIEEVSDEELYKTPFLAISLDNGRLDRVSDQRIKNAAKIVLIDHHEYGEDFGEYNFVITGYSSCAEIVATLIDTKPLKGKLPVKAAQYLYTGIIGDTGRFNFSSTTSDTFLVASRLVKTGFSLQKDVYLPLYMKTQADIQGRKYVLNHFSVTEHGVGYYILESDFFSEYKLSFTQGKEFIHELANIEDIFIWCSFSQNPVDNSYKVSVRSRFARINDICAKHNGGGHANAAGATVYSKDELDILLSELDALLI
jgi:phosphoesterase RecJ-like protein